MLDVTGRGSYRRRLRKLDAGLAADRAGDRPAAERAAAERHALVRELCRAAGLAGRQRAASAGAERGRVSVTRALRASVDRISVSTLRLRASMLTGAACPVPARARWPRGLAPVTCIPARMAGGQPYKSFAAGLRLWGNGRH